MTQAPQLLMIWPEGRPAAPPGKWPLGYTLRLLCEGDEDAHVDLMRRSGFTTWTREDLSRWRAQALPDGVFVVEHTPTARLAATAMAVHRPTDRFPGGGELGWVATDPDHRGRRLGEAVSAAAVDRFLRADYRYIYLKTDDFRHSAIRMYLRMGFEPVEDDRSMAERWRALRDLPGLPPAGEPKGMTC